MIVMCVACGAQIYRCTVIETKASGDVVDASDFVPIEEGVPQPKENDEMLCPKCDQPFMGRSGDGGYVLKLEGDLWWPHPPTSKLTSSDDRDQTRTVLKEER